MNAHALSVLQFSEALELVARHAASALGGEAVRALRPATSHDVVTAELRRVAEMLRFHARGEWTPPNLPDLRAELRRLALDGAVWDAPVLRDAAALLQNSRTAKRALHHAREDLPLLARIAERLSAPEAPERAIRDAIDDAGEVRDGATRELASIRREMRGARSRIVQKLEQYMGSLPERFRVTDASVTLREGRYVIPVRREGRGEVGGIVHDESATGGTLFVEPPLALELMNRLRELEIAEAREVQRILRELTAMLRPHHDALEASLDALVELDTLYARARYAAEHRGDPPAIALGAREYRVVDGRHPILLAGGQPVVPFDLELAADEHTLLVSGPNTGGKTVFLKAVGLISALAQAGVVPPVGPGTRLPLFHDVFADIGDEQSIEASLSTFSAHLKNLREIVEHADAGSLVLIDEIGSGTDPAEGAALAHAVLTELTRRGTMTIATSHLGELKTLATTESGVVNASLQFDSQELRPTYRLVKGIPGRSYGLAIARRLGFPQAVLERAEAHLPAAERDAGALLVELEEKERALSAALAEVEEARAQTSTLQVELEARGETLRQREREAERRARQQARDFLLAAREEVETAIRELRERAAAGDAAFDDATRAARRRLEDAARAQAERAPAETRGAGAAPGGIEVGARVRVAATGATGTVVEIRDGRAVVESSGLRLQMPVAALEPIERAAEPALTRKRSGGWSAPEVHASPEVDLRGLRADEVAGRLEPAIDAATRADLPSLRIIHGKGTGALRSVVTELLRGDPRVRAFRAGQFGEGGAGVTVAELA